MPRWPRPGERLPADLRARLRTGLAAVVGVDAVINLRDICGLGPTAIGDTFAWTARSIVGPPRTGRGRIGMPTTCT